MVRVRAVTHAALGFCLLAVACRSGSQGVVGADADDPSDAGSEMHGGGDGPEDVVSDQPGDVGPERGDAPRPEGVLIRASMKSYVGVLLDELPADVRARVADALLVEAPAFWIARAARQVELTAYYRSVAFKVIALPPRADWRIQLVGQPFRDTVDRHEVVAIEYSFSGILLGEEASARETTPRLEAPGDRVHYQFGGTLSGLPVDPDLLYERIALDCLDRMNGVLPFLLCPAAVAKWVGRVPAILTFERLPFDAAMASEIRRGNVTNTDGADLEVLGEDLKNNEITYRYFPANDCAIVEKCIGGTGWRRLLQFDATVHNKGAKALHLGEVMGSDLERHHVFQHSRCHDHYHFLHYGDFTLGSNMGDKRAFCLMSTSRMSNNEWTPIITPYAEQCTYQGIAAGWGDTYDRSLDCQLIDITDVPIAGESVKLPLKFVSNPEQFLCEGTPILDADGRPVFEPTTFKDEKGAPIDRPKCDFFPGWNSNNSGTTDVTLPKTGSIVTSPCSDKVFGPRRSCGLSEQDAKVACPPGEKVTLSCQVADPTVPQVLRACRTSDALGISMPCSAFGGLTSAVVGAATVVSFTCPSRLDANEGGGAYSLYVGPAIPGDAVQKVTCSAM